MADSDSKGPQHLELAAVLSHVVCARDEEQRALARQLHDELGSSITALSMHLGMLTQALPDDPRLRDRAATMKQVLAKLVHANRAMQLQLWNDKLEFLGIKAALSEVVSDFGARHALQTRLSLPDEDAHYPRKHAIALLRCAEEGLRNILTHARASEVDVILDDNDEEIMLTICDNGVGPGAGLFRVGLSVTHQRATHLGGSLMLATHTPCGAKLILVLPKTQEALPA